MEIKFGIHTIQPIYSWELAISVSRTNVSFGCWEGRRNCQNTWAVAIHWANKDKRHLASNSIQSNVLGSNLVNCSWLSWSLAANAQRHRGIREFNAAGNCISVLVMVILLLALFIPVTGKVVIHLEVSRILYRICTLSQSKVFSPELLWIWGNGWHCLVISSTTPPGKSDSVFQTQKSTFPCVCFDNRWLVSNLLGPADFTVANSVRVNLYSTNNVFQECVDLCHICENNKTFLCDQ